ncbi:MAG: metallophosphoesterase [Nitrospiraceae bacterium]|nr:MAG: metallophosphoesterase [Nitrospiraceae bacterium]
MRLFLLAFFTIYGLMHLYAFLKARAALRFTAAAAVPVLIFMAVMVAAPALVRYLERYGQEMPARILSHVGYIWLGLLFLFVSASFALDIYRIVVFLAGGVSRRGMSVLSLSPGVSFFLALVFACSAAVYGYFDARNIRTEHITIPTAKLPVGRNRLRLVQISDVHAGLIVREDRLRRIAGAVRAAGPHILVSTGDLVDGQINRLEGLAEILRGIDSPLGKYAITGNHEFYAGLEQALDFTEKAGFEILRDRAADVAGVVNLIGVDDQTAARQYGIMNEEAEGRLLAQADQKIFTILLKHRPLVEKQSLGLFDLQLSGHTHKGQIFPFTLVTNLYYPRHAGILHLQGYSRLYVSRGSGTWGPPIRFLSPPEVTIVDLVREEGR